MSSIDALCLAIAARGGVRYRVLQLQLEHAAQQEFSRKLIASQENERKRIAAELHDGLGQNLLVIKNRALLALLNENRNGTMSEQVGEISTMISHTIEEVRQIARDLRPYQLDRLGLTLALESIVRNLCETPQLECAGDIDNVDDLFAPEAEINLFRIVQECANNIIKHSHATRAGIVVERSRNFVKVTIRDNGRGFNAAAEAANAQRGLGLTGVSERARILNAEYDIIAASNQGVAVILHIPIPESV